MSWSALSQEQRELAEQKLTPRQLEILKLKLARRTHSEIALGLTISPSTVASHWFRIQQKLSMEEAA